MEWLVWRGKSQCVVGIAENIDHVTQLLFTLYALLVKCGRFGNLCHIFIGETVRIIFLKPLC